jgi:hypothetical protein
MRRMLPIAFLLMTALLSAQVDLPVFGKQNVISGYAKDLEGEVISYFSVYPEQATDALLTRCTDGKKAIAWETAPVPHYPQNEDIPYYYFSWIAAHSSTTSGGDRDFDLYIGEEKVLTFTTHHDTAPGSWYAAGADSTKLVFAFRSTDRYGDAHGFAHLRVPRKYITPGKPLRLKITGHAQNSPDWFMTFRYSFEEKVKVEALPFLLKGPEAARHPILFTVMHFGAPEEMSFEVQGEGKQQVTVRNGLQTFQFPVGEHRTGATRIKAFSGRNVLLDTVLDIQAVIPRDIYLVHHSHNDIGYSALQTEVEKIQNKNIHDALDLIDKTKDYPPDSRFRWNIESLWAVENFLGQCGETDRQRFIAAVKGGNIALSANYANILTGLCTPEEMNWIVEYADSLRKWYGLPINTAMQTDIPGMSWSMVDAHAGNGVRYLSQGPNYMPDLPDGGDRIGGTLREQGDKPYWWKGTTGRDSILVWTAGHGYSDWHAFKAGDIRARGTRKIAAYLNELAAKHYPYDMVQWRYSIRGDNGPVDSSLSDFVRDWNAQYSSPRLIIANVNDMMAAFERKYGKQIPTWSGDFTPYWEDGAYSTAKEEGDVRVLSARLSNLIDAAKLLKKPIDPHLLYPAQRSIVMWHEHTWGAWNSISDPDDPEVIAQWKYKKAFADSAEWYVDAIEDQMFASSGDTARAKCSLMIDHGRIVECDEERSLFQGDLFGTIQGRRNPSMSIPYATGSTHSGGQRVLNSTLDMVGIPSGKGNLLEWHRKTDAMDDSVEIPELIHKGYCPFPVQFWWDPLVVKITGTDSIETTVGYLAYGDSIFRVKETIHKKAVRSKESLHLALPFDIPNATVRIGISDTCVTPEAGRIPGSNNDFFCAQRWIDVSNDSMGVTIVCPQGALWEVGEMVDERKLDHGYKRWKTEAHSSSTLYLYALNNYWHTNFKADQEGPVTFDIYLKMHGPFKLEDARRFGLEMTRPLITWWK